MIHLEHFLHRKTLHPLAPASHDDLLRELLRRCYRQAGEPIDEARLDDMVRAHALKDQSLGKGFALSHARLDSLPEIRLSVGLLGQPQRFLRRDRAHTVFCVLIPSDHSREYLSFLARLSRFIQSPGATEVFQTADVDRILSFLNAHND